MVTGNSKNSELAEKARGLFSERAAQALPLIAKVIYEKLSALSVQNTRPRESQLPPDALQVFQRSGGAWVNATARAWKTAQNRCAPAEHSRLTDGYGLELVGDDVVEEKILASRLSMRIVDFVSWELNDLRLRIQSLEGVDELSNRDILRPELLALHMVAQWRAVLLPRGLWSLVQDTLQRATGEHLLQVYHATNEFLVQQGVMAEIDLRALVRRTPSAVVSRQDTLAAAAAGSGSATVAGPIGSGALSQTTAYGSVQAQTRMQTAGTPLLRAKIRAQGVMGHLRRLLGDQAVNFDASRPRQASAELSRLMDNAQLVAQQTRAIELLRDGVQGGPGYGLAQVNRAINMVRDRASAFKKVAASQSEKATIEIVALMFQSILAEDRIPSVIRVWFARLQIPVLRVAIAEPEFFGSLQHPARRLIDRMGSCVLGFNVTVGGNAMQAEVKRAVEVIEQYPETGSKVFQIVYDEFEKFLSKFLTGQGSAARVVGVAQQVEQKETLAIQYTIEMRHTLEDMAVRDEIRNFLFKIWTEVLAIASMKNGPQHADTLALKRAAVDLVWAASAKPSRQDRAQVISCLPTLLQALRQGMSLLGLAVPVQDQHIKSISDTLADAFASKTAPISAARIDAMASRLANLEDYLSDEDIGDLPLDTDRLVTMLGMDAAEISVITGGGSQPSQAMRVWMQELQLGSWFTLDHNGKLSNVQLAWCSERKQLHLFAAADGHNFLIQARRLAAYLQAGLLLPSEEESLTVRATREALAKIQANPERLLR